MGHRDTRASCVYGVNRALVGAYENATTTKLPTYMRKEYQEEHKMGV